MDKERLIKDLQHASEIEPDTYDGSYELMRVIVKAYSTMVSYDECTFRDLNAIYMMAIGTFKANIEKKKEYVQRGCLSQEQKEIMCQALDRVWDNACHFLYQNEEKNKPTIGMFGTGFYSFENKTTQKSVQSFIRMLVDISNEDDDNKIYDRVESTLTSEFRGMGAASASVILHCLKPYVFPILNSNYGWGTIYESLGIEFDRVGDVSTYVENCREVKRFRDEHFQFKNYRVLDLWARKLDQYRGPEDHPIEMTGDTTEVREEKLNEVSLNTILFGPPGTGKTYNTIMYSVAIIEKKPLSSIRSEASTDYARVKARFDNYRRLGRIAFTTFHQSYGYEEFIEGIKPVVDSENTDVAYSIESGIFKKFCDKARVIQEDEIEYTGTVWNYRNRAGDKDVASDFEDSLYSGGVIKIEDINDEARQCNYLNDMAAGDWVVLGRNHSINAIGIIVDDEPEEIDDGIFHYQRKVEWKITGIKHDCKAINRGKGFSNFALAGSWMKVRDLQQIIDGDTNNEQPYVFIIDEINRGNISKIFGELITLIEDTKREGMQEAASARLPYSGESFSVPNNVYILGTMNTADRSIALMDTALRRRFSFEEMMPDTDVLRSLRADKVADFDVAEMLDVINERITFLYDREHTIGHAFFTSLKDDPTIENLANIFKKSIIPLLQEYFYEDYQKIQMVLGDNGKANDSYKFIKDSTVVVKKIFKGSVDDIVDLPEKKYEINEDALYNLESYKQIV